MVTTISCWFKIPPLIPCVLSLFLFCTLGHCCRATSVVVVRTPEVVVIAADSLQVNTAGNNVTRVKVCKITLLGKRSAFASAGLSESVGNFSAEELALEAWEKGYTLRAREQAFAEAITPKLAAVLQIMKDHAPEHFAKFKKIALETFFITVENKVPKVVETNYFTHVNREGKVYLTAEKGFCPGNCSRPDMAYINYLGEFAAIQKAMKTRLTFPYPADLASGLVQIEVTNANDTVAPPISTLQITEKERRWLTPGECERTPRVEGNQK